MLNKKSKIPQKQRERALTNRPEITESNNPQSTPPKVIRKLRQKRKKEIIAATKLDIGSK